MKPFIDITYFYNLIISPVIKGVELIFENEFWESLLWVKVVSTVFIVVFLIGIIYNIVKLVKMKKKQIKEFAKIVIEDLPERRVSRWDAIKKRLDSGNSSDWKQAILEADSILDDIIKDIGYKGETFGERLSQILPSQFKNLEEVWIAHKVRNRIAHQGTEFELTKTDAEQVIGLYEKALEELEYI